MMTDAASPSSFAIRLARRLFLGRLATGAGVLSAAALSPERLAASPASAASAAPDQPWRPARHPQDDWFDQLPGEHRFIFDTTSADGMFWALRFAGNYFTANHDEYALKDTDLAVVIVARHKSAPFGYNNAMWTKYSKYLSEHAEFVDPKTKEPPSVNLYASPDESTAQPGPLAELTKKGVNFAVCAMSTHAIAGKIAKGTGSNADAAFKELSANLVPNGRLVSAGIVAINRAQERGYSLASAG